MNEERSAIIIKLRQSLIGATMAYQSGYRECADNKDVMSAQPNKVVFRITHHAMQELDSAL
jgi:hypothetical protein